MDPPRIGVCSWSVRPESARHLANILRELDLDVCQLALAPVSEGVANWVDAIAILRDSGVSIASGMLAMRGEDYSTLQTIRATGGVAPDADWPENLARSRAVAQVAGAAGIELVTLHAGFIPHDRADPHREVLLDRLRTVADAFDGHGVKLAFETGQETAETLLEALADLDRPTVGVNFDPANMILYGMGDPIEALRRLSPQVRQIHVKDAIPAMTPGAWGAEVPAGEGSVDWSAFFDVAGALSPPVEFIIEREAGESRMADIAAARDLIRRHLDEGATA